MPLLRSCPVLILLLLLLARPLAAQPEPSPDAVHHLRPGAWALQFGAMSLGLLTSDLGKTISAKHHTRPDRALRYGLSVNGGLRRSDDTQRSYDE